MPDISMCFGEYQTKVCPKRDTCYRYKANANPYYQAYYSEPNCTENCESYWRIDETRTNENTTRNAQRTTR